MTTEIIAPKNNLELIKVQGEAIRAIGASRGGMHKALVMTLLHVLNHDDWNGAKMFLIAIKGDEHTKTLAKKIQAWLEQFGGMVVSADKTQPDTLGQIVGYRGQAYIAGNIELAKATPWYTSAKVEQSFAGFSLDEALGKVLNEAGRINKKLTEGGFNELDAQKVKMGVSQATLNALLSACGLEAVLNDDAVEVLQG